MTDSGPNPESKTRKEFLEEIQKHHLAQVLVSKYGANPDLLGQHYEINFMPLPAFEAHGEDPARDSVVILLSYKPEHKVPHFGNLLIPENFQGKALYETTELIRMFRLVAAV